jgi:hypothetical protein
MKKSFHIFLSYVLIPVHVFASIEISSLLPNPSWDDALGEYIEMRNTWCDSVDVSGYRLSDLSWKTYIIPSGTHFSSHESKKFLYSETKIALNNSWEEAVFLRDTLWNIVDEYRYSGTQKDDIILTVSLTDTDCSVPDWGTNSWTIEDIVTESGEVLTGAIISFTWEIIASGSTGIWDIFTDSGSTNTWEILMNSWEIMVEVATWALSLSGEIGEVLFSGSAPSFSGESLSWTEIRTTEEIYTGETLVYTETWALEPVEMYYLDHDKNHKIDTLEIIYPHILTGSVNVNQISLYSNTGWLSNNRINTLTGHIISWSLSGNILILSLIEGDREHLSLKVTNTTLSDLRLKATWDMGIRSLWWQKAENFLLTDSFDRYKKVYPKGIFIEESVVSNTGSTVETGTTLTWDTLPREVEDIITEILSWSLATWKILFPEIIPTIQSPTNASFSWDIFTCTSSDCRINITLEPIFSSGFAMRDYSCSFGTGDFFIPDSDCNPNTLYFSSSGSLRIELRNKKNPLESLVKTYPVLYVPKTQTEININPQNITPDTTKPVAILELDGKEKEYYEQIGEHEMNCYTATCSINWTAEKSYDKEGGKLAFLWIYGQNQISTSRDPGVRKYTLWDHRMILRVIDEAGNYDEIMYTIHVLWPKPKIAKEKTIKATKTVKKETLALSITPEKQKAKKIKMIFFSPPEILLQGTTGKKSWSNSYTCEYKRTKTCNFNLSLTGTTKGHTYMWFVDGKESYKGKNPKAWKLTPWNHKIEILTFQKDATMVSDKKEITVKVVAAPKKVAKKKIKVKKSSSKKTTTKKVTIIPTVKANSWRSDGEEKEFPISISLVFLAGLGMAYLTRRKKSRK